MNHFNKQTNSHWPEDLFKAHEAAAKHLETILPHRKTRE